MRNRFTTPAIVLQTRRYRDRDRWVTLLTPEDGRVSVLARGVGTMQSKRRAALQSGNLIRCNWVTRGDYHTLTEAVYEESLLVSESNLDRMRDFSAVLEVVHHLALESFEQLEYFDASAAILRYVGQSNPYHRGRVRHLLLDLAALQGVQAPEDQPSASVSDLLEHMLDRKVRSFAFLQV